MNRHSLAAIAVAAALATTGMLFAAPTEAEAQCLDRAACGEIKAEVARLQPDFRAAKQQLRKARRALKTLEPGSERWVTKRARLKRFKKAFRSTQRELKALQQDFRHQACSSC